MRWCLSLVGVFAAVITGAPSRAVAAAEPLVVVVETRPGAGVDPGEVRRAIADELRIPVRAPRDAAAEETGDLLIVTVDRGEIQLSLRARASSVVTRTVPAPGDRKARLQSIGWLAGNLARDQVSALVVAAAAPSAEAAPAPVEPAASPEAPPPAPPPPTEPPPLAQPRDLAPPSAGVIAARPGSAAVKTASGWSLTIGGGPSALWTGLNDREFPAWPGPGIWYLEVQRRAPGRHLIIGATLEIGPDMALGIAANAPNFVGSAALLGLGHQFGRIFLEATAGAGLEAYQYGRQVQTTSEIISGISLGLYLRGQATAGVTLWRSLDLLASGGGHFGSAGRWDYFLTTSLGLRYRFP
jgi:hypothetical protein